MKPLHWMGLAMIFGALVLIGCQQQTPEKSNKNGEHKEGEHKHGEHKHGEKEHAKIEAALAKLGSEDRKLAEAQKMCPISGEPLGSMGTPITVIVKDQPVFLCCKGCRKNALADPEKTLAKVKELKANAQK